MAIEQKLGPVKLATLMRVVGQVAAVTILLVGCSKESAAPGEIETVDVAPSRTAVLTTIYDDVAPQRDESFSGVLPQGFPADLPLYDPSNLTDFGDIDTGGKYVLMFSPDSAAMVRDRMAGELKRSGWALIRGDGEQGSYRRGSRRVTLAIQEAQPGTEIRVEY
jgi:hypothetical protein